VLWYEKAAAKGDAWARYALGSHLWLGAGVDRDAPAADKWFGLAGGDDYSALVQRFKSAAADGEDDAEFFLGMMYLQGHGVPQDEAKAVECFENASERGYKLGQVAIAALDNS
jgi:TPR repeat protein